MLGIRCGARKVPLFWSCVIYGVWLLPFPERTSPSIWGGFPDGPLPRPPPPLVNRKPSFFTAVLPFDLHGVEACHGGQSGRDQTLLILKVWSQGSNFVMDLRGVHLLGLGIRLSRYRTLRIAFALRCPHRLIVGKRCV